MHGLPLNNSNQRPLDAMQQPSVHLLHGQAYQAPRHTENAHKRPNSSQAAGGFSGCNSLRAQRDGTKGAAQKRALGAAYRSQAKKGVM